MKTADAEFEEGVKILCRLKLVKEREVGGLKQYQLTQFGRFATVTRLTHILMRIGYWKWKNAR